MSADQHRFFDGACMSLMSLDMHELVEAGVIDPGNIRGGGSSWKRFNDQPLLFLAKIDDAKRDALRKLLEARQRSPSDRDVAIKALTVASHAVRSYQYGNGAPDLAQITVDFCDKTVSYLQGGA